MQNYQKKWREKAIAAAQRLGKSPDEKKLIYRGFIEGAKEFEKSYQFECSSGGMMGRSYFIPDVDEDFVNNTDDCPFVAKDPPQIEYYESMFQDAIDNFVLKVKRER